jgi:superfamily II DNA or RNA helicase
LVTAPLEDLLMRYSLYDYQRVAVADAEAFLKSAPRGGRRLYCSPTGSGKGIIEVELLRRLGSSCLLVTPRIEIIHGLLDKLGHDLTDRSATPWPTACWRGGRGR